MFLRKRPGAHCVLERYQKGPIQSDRIFKSLSLGVCSDCSSLAGTR